MKYESTEQFFGKRICGEYRNLFPIFRLITHTIDAMYPSPLGMECGFFAYENTLSDYKKWTEKCAYMIGIVPFCFRRIFCKRLNENTILVTDRLLKFDRYAGIQEKLYERSNIIGVHRLTAPLLLKNIIFHRKEYNYKRFFEVGTCVPGIKLKKKLVKLYRKLEELVLMGDVCDNHYAVLKEMLDEIQKLYLKRLLYLKRELKRNRTNLFLTINQYNIGDLMLCIACHELNIKSVEWQHHEWKVCPVRASGYAFATEQKVIFKDNCGLFTAVDEFWVWNNADGRWMSNHLEYVHLFHKDIIFRTMGSPEIDLDEIRNKINNGMRRNILTIMVPVNIERTLSFDEKTNLLFDYVNTLAKNNDFDVYLKYHQSDSEGRKRGYFIAEKYGFTVMDSSHNGLVKCLCESKIIFGFISSALTVAANYGVRSICVKMSEEDVFDLEGASFELVDLRDIPTMQIVGNNEYRIGDDSYNEHMVEWDW